MSTDLTTIEENATLREAAKRLLEGGISCLPVMRGEKLVGVITTSDFVQVFQSPGTVAGAEAWSDLSD